MHSWKHDGMERSWEWAEGARSSLQPCQPLLQPSTGPGSHPYSETEVLPRILWVPGIYPHVPLFL